MFTHLDLFSGIGGFSRAVEWLGGETAAFVEWDAWNRRVLAKHWPDAAYFGDIHDVGTDDLLGLGHIDLLTGGYPCQPFSHAGKRLGAEDDRHLWPEMRRVLNLVRPRWMLAENVAGHVTMGLDTVLAELEADGYACGAVVIPACAVNALHRRDRVWIMADAEARGLRRGRAPRADGQPAQRGQGVADPGGQRHRAIHGCLREGEESIAEYSGGGVEGCGPENRQAPWSLDAGLDELSAGLVRRPAARSPWDDPDMIRQMWADGSWEFGLPRVVAEEAERRQKLQAAGNAIVAVVAYEILRVMLDYQS